MRQIGKLLDRQPVEFRPNHDGRSGRLALVYGCDSMAAETRDESIGACGSQERMNVPGRLNLLSGEFRRAVELVPKSRQLDHVFIGQNHGSPPHLSSLGADRSTDDSPACFGPTLWPKGWALIKPSICRRQQVK